MPETLTPPLAETSRHQNQHALLGALESYIATTSDPSLLSSSQWTRKQNTLEQLREQDIAGCISDTSRPLDEDVLDEHAQAFSSMKTNHQLVETLDAREPSAEEPALTVCVPIALLSEDQERIEKTVALISRAQQRLGEPIELLLWANAHHRNDSADRETVTRNAQERYEGLKTILEQKSNNPGLTIKTAIQILPLKKATMSRLRSNYMEAVAFNAAEQGYGFDHPVLWLDADITSLSSNALRDIERSVRGFEATLVHTNVHYSLDWLKDKTFAGMDDTSKAIALGEILRRQKARQKDMDPDFKIYPEESGLAFALGTYLEAGGINTYRPVDESYELRERIEAARDGYFWGHNPANPRSSPPHSRRHIVPEFLHTKPGPISLEKTLPTAHMGLSARRHYAIVRQKGIRGIEAYDCEHGSDYVLFADMQKVEPPKEPEPIYRHDLRNILGRIAREASRTPELRKRVDLITRLIDSHFSV